jgi:hypothetical protein
MQVLHPLLREMSSDGAAAWGRQRRVQILHPHKVRTHPLHTSVGTHMDVHAHMHGHTNPRACAKARACVPTCMRTGAGKWNHVQANAHVTHTHVHPRARNRTRVGGGEGLVCCGTNNMVLTTWRTSYGAYHMAHMRLRLHGASTKARPIYLFVTHLQITSHSHKLGRRDGLLAANLSITRLQSGSHLRELGKGNF